MPPSNSTYSNYIKMPTSEEGVLEGEGVENSESVGGAHCETTLVLVEAYEKDLLMGDVGGCTLHKSAGLDYS